MVISASAMEVDNCSLSGDSSTDESDGEIQLDEGKVKCLFCDSQFPEVKELLNHCNSGHQCQLLDLCRKARLCCFGYLKMINYVRSRQINVDQLKVNNRSSGVHQFEDLIGLFCRKYFIRVCSHGRARCF